jgi:hypothetical protein
MGEAGAHMVSGTVEGDLGFIFEAAEGGAVNDALSVPLEFRAEVVGFLRVFPTQALPTFRSVGGKRKSFFLFPVFSSAERHSSGMEIHRRVSRDGIYRSSNDVNIGWMI